jgi:hypothetical protein
VDREEVDAIEAVPVPEPAVWLGLVSGASWLGWLSRMRR